MPEHPAGPASGRAANDPGHSLKPYLAIVTLLVVVGVVSYSLVDRWLADPQSESEGSGTIEGGGRVVIGQSDPRTAAPPVAAESSNADSTYRPQEFTFYKSLGSESQVPPKLEPKPPTESQASTPQATPKGEEAGRKPVTHKSYTVQIGSFQNRKAAESLAAKVRHYQYSVSVTRVVLPDTGVRYRVRMGSFATREDALKLAETLKKKERTIDPFVATNLPPSG